jgi:hypothetical protein
MDATLLAVSGKTTKFTLQVRGSVSEAALTGTVHLYDTVGALIDTLTWTGAGDVAPTTKNTAVAIALPAGVTYYLAAAHVSANPGAFTVYYARLIPQWV